MKFSIITPTHNRPEQLLRAVASVIQQTYADWELFVVNDAPGNGTKAVLSQYLNDSRIHFFENDQNHGVNFSRNQALNAISQDSDYVIFLDDDDYFTSSTLATIAEIIEKVGCSWLITNRGTSTKQPTTYAPKDNTYYRYAWDYLITKKIKGDATHAIASPYINGLRAKLRFPIHIKQAEEWLFYLALSNETKLYYTDVVTTLTDGYTSTGLNLRTRTVTEQISRIPMFIQEGFPYGLHKRIAFWVYCGIRFVRSFIR